MLSAPLLAWATVAISIFNTIALVWLGLTVLLNAERRTWGAWIAGGGLLLGGLFFAGHSAAVRRALGTFGPELDFWWRIVWLPVVGGPYLWYVVVAWYTGVLSTSWHRIAVLLLTLAGAIALGQFVVANPLPTYTQVVDRAPVRLLALRGIPLISLVYPIFSVLCILLALAALGRPAPSARFMGDIARRRARPWLVAASLVLLGICLLFGVTVAWFLGQVVLQPPPFFYLRLLSRLQTLDLVMTGLVALVVVLIGRAIVSYEIFTGKALPRGGLQRYWQRSLILAAGYGSVIGASLNIPVDPIYRLLLATVLMTAFYALLGWRSYTDREHSISGLRPFVRSQRLYDHLVRPADPEHADVIEPFEALCADVLGARTAYLQALEPLSELVGEPLVFPSGAQAPTSAVNDIVDQLRAPQMMCLALNPAGYGGAVWAVPLWHERGLIGVLLLGEKRDGGLYTQEEIEIARATGERLIDTRASVELARRLLMLQRQHLAETQVVDRRARRVLHDDVLPRLHAALLLMSAVPSTGASDGPGDQLSEPVALLTDAHQEISNLLHELPSPMPIDVARLGLIPALRRTVEHDLGENFEQVSWEIDPQVERRTAVLPARTTEVLFYATREAIRNAARYGRGTERSRALHLCLSVHWDEGLTIIIEDDGVGLGAAAPSSAGAGQGLLLHSTMMAVVGGTLTASRSASGTRVVLALPQTAYGALMA